MHARQVLETRYFAIFSETSFLPLGSSSDMDVRNEHLNQNGYGHHAHAHNMYTLFTWDDLLEYRLPFIPHVRRLVGGLPEFRVDAAGWRPS